MKTVNNNNERMVEIIVDSCVVFRSFENGKNDLRISLNVK